MEFDSYPNEETAAMIFDIHIVFTTISMTWASAPVSVSVMSVQTMIEEGQHEPYTDR